MGNLGLLEGMSRLLSLHGPTTKLPLLQTPIFLYCLALLWLETHVSGLRGDEFIFGGEDWSVAFPAGSPRDFDGP